MINAIDNLIYTSQETGSDKSYCSHPTNRAFEIINCKCGLEYYHMNLWQWDNVNVTKEVSISKRKRDAFFHKRVSKGTAVVRGNKVFEKNKHYFWELKMITAVYGTNVMIGVGTDRFDVLEFRNGYCGPLGEDAESWGYSYRGYLQQEGMYRSYGFGFGCGSLVGVHLDMFAGTLEYYVNRKRLGIAFTGLKDKILYPLVSSTALKSGVKITCSLEEPESLQIALLRKINPYSIPPGNRKMMYNRFWWLMRNNEPEYLTLDDDDDDDEEYDSWS